MLENNLRVVRLDIDAICRKVGRKSSDVVLVGVTKYSDVTVVNEAVALGLKNIAENRVQSAKEKFVQLSVPSVTKHLIGHLQSNKVKEAVELFDLIQSVDSLSLLDEINKRAGAIAKVQEILLQVDIAKEEQKFGLPEGEVKAFCDHAQGLKNISLRGLMTMAPLTEDQALIRSVFRRAHEIFDELRVYSGNIQMKHLSMGMSGDYALAIEEGSTMVRIGSLIFRD